MWRLAGMASGVLLAQTPPACLASGKQHLPHVHPHCPSCTFEDCSLMQLALQVGSSQAFVPLQHCELLVHVRHAAHSGG